MCGIAGFCINPAEHLPRRSRIAAALLAQIEVRGTDSTGMAWTDTKYRKVTVCKRPVRASKFITSGAVKAMEDSAVAAVLHTRYATQGTHHNNVNNHPITSGAVVGVHNGHINNDDELFDSLKCERHGKVDSEAAFALLAHGSGKVVDRLPLLRGRAALAWFDKRDAHSAKSPVLHLVRHDGSPLAIGQTKRGSLFFASTMDLLHGAMSELGIDLAWELNVSEGTYLKVKGGKIVSHETYNLPKASPKAWTFGKPAAGLRDLPLSWLEDDEEHAAYLDSVEEDWRVPADWR